jgi:hypothetical protein
MERPKFKKNQVSDEPDVTRRTGEMCTKFILLDSTTIQHNYRAQLYRSSILIFFSFYVARYMIARVTKQIGTMSPKSDRWKHNGKRSLGRPKHRWVNIISRPDLDVRIQLVQDTVIWGLL